MGPGPEYHWNYLSRYYSLRLELILNKHLLAYIHASVSRQVLEVMKLKNIGLDYKTWDAQSYVSSYTFKYPPKKGSMTQSLQTT